MYLDKNIQPKIVDVEPIKYSRSNMNFFRLGVVSRKFTAPSAEFSANYTIIKIIFINLSIFYITKKFGHV
jgi:hypothetical protein